MQTPPVEPESSASTEIPPAEQIRKEIVELRQLTIVSERRLIPAIMQLRRYWPNRKTTEKEEYEKALKALLMTLLPTILWGGGGGGFLTIVIAIATIYLGYRSNQIGNQSNTLLDRQIAVEEDARRATLYAEITAIFDQINNFQISEPKSRTLPSSITSRIQAVSHAMLPYWQQSPSQIKEKYSPERSHLLYVLADLRLTDYRPIFENSDFSYSIVNKFELFDATAKVGAKFRNCKFEGATFVRDTILRSDFSLTTIEGGRILTSNFSGTDFSSAVMENVLISCTQFKYCDFRAATLKGVLIDHFDAFQGSNFEGATVDSSFYTNVILPLRIPANHVRVR